MHQSTGLFGRLAKLTDAETRSVSAENPTGAVGSGAMAAPGDDEHCTAAADELGVGWKVRPCIRIPAGARAVIADLEGPGAVTHIWITVNPIFLRQLVLRVMYDDATVPSIECPLGDFFANGLDGLALVDSAVVAVNPRGGMNCYWPMPFRKRLRVEIANDSQDDLGEFFYQLSYEKRLVDDDEAYLHARWHRSLTSRDHPEHEILNGVEGRGHYVGTYLVWNQFSNGWWGEGEVKFYLDGDQDHPTICGTGTEDYFGGAWGFRAAESPETGGPVNYSTAFLGYPQAIIGGERVPAHALYRWHLPDPVRFRRDLRVTIQALGWYPTGKYQPLTDDIASTAFWYQTPASAVGPGLPPLNERLPR